MILAFLCSAPLILAQPTPPPAPTERAPQIFALAPADSPETAGPNDLEQGPKLKSRSPRSIGDPVPVPVPPQPPRLAAPALPAVPVPPDPLIAAVPSAPPARTSRAPHARAKDSFEERLARAERMLESLLDHKKMQRDDEFNFKWPEMKMEFKGLGKESGLMGEKELEKIKQAATRDAARATEEVQRATREMEKARLKHQTYGPVKEASQRQIEAMRRQLEHLDRQKEALGRQIERLERDRQKLDQRDGDEDPDEVEQEETDDEGQTKEECITTHQAPL